MDRQAHWIPDNKGASVPQRLVVIDAQPITVVEGTVRTHRWRCGTAAFIHWTRDGTRRVQVRDYAESAQLWDDVVGFARPKRRTVVYFHNVPYRLRLTAGLIGMASRGFVPTRMRLSSRGAFVSWKRDDLSVTVADVAGLFSASQDTMSTAMGVPLPAITDDRDAAQWQARSVATCRLWTTFISEYMEWLRTGECGNWQLTGAGQAWSNWRHSSYTHRVLVHCDADALAAEREAMFAGRAEMYWHGRDLTMPAYEWDWKSAYLRIAKENDLPSELVSRINKPKLKEVMKLADKYAVLCRIVTTTAVPVVPARVDKGILWPVGTLRTTVWEQELRELEATGAKIRVEEAWLYRRAPVLRQWASKMLSATLIPATADQQWKKYVAKHWGRALIGRFAARYQEWDKVCELPWDDITIGTWVDRDSGSVLDTAQIGRELYLSDGYVEAAHSAPQITSWVMGAARVKLWRAVNSIGPSNVLYVNTDSLVTNAVGHREITRIRLNGGLDGLELKQRCRGVEIYGHQSAVLGDTTKLAGCPTGAARLTESTWVGECWSSLDHAVKTGELDSVTITKRRYTVRYSDRRRERLAGHATQPWEVTVNDEGATVRVR